MFYSLFRWLFLPRYEHMVFNRWERVPRLNCGESSSNYKSVDALLADGWEPYGSAPAAPAGMAGAASDFCVTTLYLRRRKS